MREWAQRLAVLASVVAVASAVLATPLRARGAPIQPQPRVQLEALGTLGARTVPLLVTWPAATTDAATINHYELERSADGGPWTPITLAKPLARSLTTKQAAWHVLVFRVRAVDQALKASNWAESAPIWIQTAQEDDPAVQRSPGWQVVARSTAFAGARAVTSDVGESATFTFTGREVGWVARLATDGGTANVSVDGGPPTSVNLHRSRSTNRRLVFRRRWLTPGLHSLTITTTTAGQKVDVDAFVVVSDPTSETLVGAGDIAVCGSSHDEATATLVESQPGIVFTTGDNVYPQGDAQYYANCYDPSWGQFKDRTRPVPGNHDYYNNPGAPSYFAYFGEAAGPAGLGYYKYEAGTWRVYALNSECAPTSACYAAQMAWLKADLDAEPHECVIALWHRPRWSSGSEHGSSTRMAAFFQTLYDAGADVVLTGHDHDYERFAPTDPSGAIDAAKGLRQWVVGTGGASLYALGTLLPASEVTNNSSHGVLRLDLAPGGYSWHFVPVAGETFNDSGSASCH
jgi:hypothetical protein